MTKNIYSSDKDIIIIYNIKDKPYGICGHLFESIDYFLFLSNFFSVEILVGEEIDKNDFNIAISKYKDTDITFNIAKPKIIQAKNSTLLFVDGNIDTSIIYNVKNILLFPCGIRDYSFLSTFKDNKKIKILCDSRLDYIIPDNIHYIHYIKKINFNQLKEIDIKPIYNVIYSTSHCKLINNDIILKYLNMYPGEELLILLNENSVLLQNTIDNVNYKIVPVDNLFSYIKRYIYTPITRKWDCSPRMIAECKFFNIPFIIDDDINDNYLENDLGLKYRLYDINNNLKSISLEDDDDIIGILNEL